MPHRLILIVTKFQLPPPTHLGTVVKNILEGHHAPSPCQIGLSYHQEQLFFINFSPFENKVFSPDIHDNKPAMFKFFTDSVRPLRHILYQRSQYSTFDCPNRTNVMIITLGNRIPGRFKISKANVKVQRSKRHQRKQNKINILQLLLAVVQRVKHCIGTKHRSLSRTDVFKIQAP